MKQAFLLVTGILLLCNHAVSQTEFDTIDWNELTAFKIFNEYPPSKQPFIELSHDELHKLKAAEKDMEKAKRTLSSLSPTGRNTALASGIQFGLARFSDGSTRLLKISPLGFQDQTDGQYYNCTSEEAYEEWGEFISK